MRFKILTTFGLLVTASIGAANSALAQAGLREGVKIRVSIPGSPETTGVIQSVTADSVVVFAEPNGAKIGIARAGIRSLKVSQGKSASAGALKGGLWGAGVFGASGVIVALGASENDPVYNDGYGGKISRSTLIAQSFVIGGLIGAGIGAFIKSEKWESVGVQPTVAFGGTELKLGFRVR